MPRKLAPLTQVRRDFEKLVDADRAAGRMTPELERLAHHTLLALRMVRVSPGRERDHEIKTAMDYAEQYSKARGSDG